MPCLPVAPSSSLSLPRLKCQTSTHAPALAPATLPLTLVCGLPVSLPCLCCSYAEGLLLAIHHLSKVGVPIYITETGVADTGDGEGRWAGWLAAAAWPPPVVGRARAGLLGRAAVPA